MTLPLVAVACFALGIAADRILFRVSEQSAGRPDGTGRPPMPTATSQSGGDGRTGDGESRSDPVAEIIDRFEESEGADFEEAVALHESLPEGRRREELLHRLAEHWGRADPEAALKWAEGLELAERNPAFESILHHWSQNDALAAIEYAAGMTNSERSLGYVHHLAHTWAEKDRAAAIEWAESREDVAVRARALRGALAAWSAEEPLAAGEYAMAVENVFERRELLAMVAHRWVDQNRVDASNWAANLEGDNRNIALRAVLNQVGESYPADAAIYYDTISTLLPKRELRDAAGDVAARWAESSPAEAAKWALGLPEENRIQRRAVHEVVHHWLNLDSLAASEWVGTLPAGETRDAAAGTLVEHVARTDPEAAFAWAKTIADEEHRTDLTHHTLDRWRDIDEPAARAAFDAAPLTAEQRRHVGEIFEEEER